MPIGFMCPKEATSEMHRGLEQQVPAKQWGRPPRRIQAFVTSRIDLTPIGKARHGRIHVTISQPQRYEDAAILDESDGRMAFKNAQHVERHAPLHPKTRDFPHMQRATADTLTDRAVLAGGRATTRRGKKRECWPLPAMSTPRKHRPTIREDDVPWKTDHDPKASGHHYVVR